MSTESRSAPWRRNVHILQRAAWTEPLLLCRDLRKKKKKNFNPWSSFDLLDLFLAVKITRQTTVQVAGPQWTHLRFFHCRSAPQAGGFLHFVTGEANDNKYLALEGIFCLSTPLVALWYYLKHRKTIKWWKPLILQKPLIFSLEN